MLVNTKLCEVCGEPFERPPGISNDNWKNRKTCKRSTCLGVAGNRAECGRKGGLTTSARRGAPVQLGEQADTGDLRNYVAWEPRIGWLFRN